MTIMEMPSMVKTIKFAIGVSLVLSIWFYQFVFKYSFGYYIFLFSVFSFLYVFLVGYIRKRRSQQFESIKHGKRVNFTFPTFRLILEHCQSLKSIDLLHLFSIIFVGLAWIFAFSIPLGEFFQDDPTYYILSSISQGLAALFALIFSLSLITAQISTKYSFHLIGKFFGMPTKLFMILFAAGVLLPLYALKTNSLFLLDVSLGLCGTNIVLLFPYISYLKNQIDPSHFLEELSEKAIEKLSTLGSSPNRNQREFPEVDYYFKEIYSIDSTILRAHREYDYDTFIIGIKKLLQIGTSECIMNERAIKEVFIRLSWIAAETVHYRDTIFQIGLPLENAAIQAIESGREFVAYEAIYALGGFIEKTLSREIDEKMWQIVWGLGEATTEAMRKKMNEPARKGIWFLGKIGKRASEQNCGYSLNWSLIHLPLMDPRVLKPDPDIDDMICECLTIKEGVVISMYEHLTDKKRIEYIMNKIISDRKKFWRRKKVRKEFIKFFWNLGAYLKEYQGDTFKDENLEKIKQVIKKINPKERKQVFDILLDLEKREKFLIELLEEIEEIKD